MPGADDESVGVVCGEELPGAVEAVLALFEGDGDGFGTAAGEGSYGGRQILVAQILVVGILAIGILALGGGVLCFGGGSGDRGCGGGEQEAAA